MAEQTFAQSIGTGVGNPSLMGCILILSFAIALVAGNASQTPVGGQQRSGIYKNGFGLLG